MAGARLSGFRKSGGFLNNVDGVIESYSFTDVFPGGDGSKSTGDFNPLWFVLTVAQDGDPKSKSLSLLAGSADDFEISEDGLTLTPVEDGNSLREGTPFFRFLQTLVTPTGEGEGFPEEMLPEEDINFEAIVGTRARFVQVKDFDAMSRLAKKWKTSKGKYNETGQKKGKDGKYYDMTLLAIEAVHSLPGAKVESKGKGKTTTATKTANVKAAGGKPNGKAVDIDELAKDTLREILTEAEDNEIMKSKLPLLITKKLGTKHPHREDVRKLIYSDDFLNQNDGWSYDASSKTQSISLDA